MTPLNYMFISIVLTLLSGLTALSAGRQRLFIQLTFALLGIGGICAMVAAVKLLTGTPGFDVTLPIGLPWLNWHLMADPLSGFFFGIIGLLTLAISFYGPGYIRGYRHTPYSLGVLGFFSSLFILGMQLVTLANDAFAFLIAWELMSVSSYFLVAFEHHESANRRAAFLYLLMAQIGAVAILLALSIPAAFSGSFTFDAFRAVELSPLWASVVFALGLLGFGMKAGLVPVHVWLPEAHPVAPSHISALMSGVMLKVAVYGFIRLIFDLLGGPTWQWGVVLLLVGSITALFGVLYALMQHDLKRLLAYHSVENIGIIFIGLGLSAIFFGNGFNKLGTLGLIAALYHTLNHALFKSLLFLGAGSILHRTHELNLERMGGLIHRLPITGLFFLIGCISISALPPFNGFVSEWLTFQAALQSTVLESGVMRAIIPVTAAMLALTGALAAACFVKVFGIAFLGQPRTRRVSKAREVDWGMLTGQGILATLCLLFGILPSTTINALNSISSSLVNEQLSTATAHGWLWLTPVSPKVASYSAPLVLLGVLLALAAWATVWLYYRKNRGSFSVSRRIPWGCGFGPLGSRMQYSASAFAMPIRRIFSPLFILHEESEREVDSALPTKPTSIRYQIHAEDITWRWLYLPIERLVFQAARRVGKIQTGNIRHYLAYSFITLLVLLWVI